MLELDEEVLDELELVELELELLELELVELELELTHFLYQCTNVVELLLLLEELDDEGGKSLHTQRYPDIFIFAV